MSKIKHPTAIDNGIVKLDEPANCGNCAFQRNRECRRHAPRNVDDVNTAIWPLVSHHDFCAEYRPTADVQLAMLDEMVDQAQAKQEALAAQIKSAFGGKGGLQ